MSSVMILDRDRAYMEYLRTEIDWKACGISDVILCEDVSEAEQILRTKEVFLVIGDLNIPGGHGFFAGERISFRLRGIPFLILSEDDSFPTVRFAMRAGAIDYLQKTEDIAELQARIVVAAGKSRDAQRKEGDQIEDFPDLLLHFFMNAGENGRVTSIDMLSSLFQFQLDPAGQYALLLIHVEPDEKKELEDSRRIFLAVRAFFMEKGVRFWTSHLIGGRMYMIVQLEYEQNDTVSLRESCAELIDIAFWRSSIFISEKITYEQIVPMSWKIIDRDRKNVLYKNRVFLVGLRNIEQEYTPEIDYSAWSASLEEGEFSRLLSQIDLAVTGLVARNQMDASTLYAVYNGFLSVMHHYIGDHPGLERVTNTEKSLAAAQQIALRSVEDFRAFFVQYVRVTEDGIRSLGSQTAAESIRRYIDHHFTERITRAELAEYAALSESYISRIFRKETGLSISEYILQKRLNKARELLVIGNLPITEISERAGFGSAAYFRRIFKEETGMTPRQYRAERRDTAVSPAEDSVDSPVFGQIEET